MLIGIKNNWKMQIHPVTDDANSANVCNETYVEFMGKM